MQCLYCGQQLLILSNIDKKSKISLKKAIVLGSKTKIFLHISLLSQVICVTTFNFHSDKVFLEKINASTKQNSCNHSNHVQLLQQLMTTTTYHLRLLKN